MNFKLKDGITKEDLIASKWDQSEYSLEQKVFWQEQMFELGFSWLGAASVEYLDRPALWCDPDMEIAQHNEVGSFFNEEAAKQLYWDDIFIEVETQQTNTHSDSLSAPLSEEFSTKESKYTKKVFTLASEALIAFEAEVELFHLVDEKYCKCNTESSVFYAYKNSNLYIKEELPWWEIVSECKPCYVVSSKGRILKLIGSPSELGNIKKEGGGTVNRVDYTPLTKEQVLDINTVMEGWL